MKVQWYQQEIGHSQKPFERQHLMVTRLPGLSTAVCYTEWSTAPTQNQSFSSALNLPAQWTRLGQNHKPGFKVTHPPGNYCQRNQASLPQSNSATAPACSLPTLKLLCLFSITIPHLSEAAEAFLNYLSLVQQDLCNVLV